MKRNLMDELTEGMDALAERRKMERDRLDERLDKNRERVDQEETFAPHMGEEQYINIYDLVKDYARLIDGQRKEIDRLQNLNESYLGQIHSCSAYRDRVQRENEILENNAKNLEIELEELRKLYDSRKG